MDINNINDVAYAWASHERNEANRGKGVRSKGWVTKEQMRKDAAQKALGIMIAIAALTILVSIFIKIFGKVTGTIMMIVLVLGFPICYLIQESTGYNIQWLPLWIVAFALALKLFTKMFGRKWGLRIGIPIVGIIALIAYHRDEPSNVPTSRSPEKSIATNFATQISAQQSSDAKTQNEYEEDNKDIEQISMDNLGGKQIVSDAEASGEKAARYLKDVSEKLNNLLVQVKTTKSPTTPDYELDSQVEYLKNTFEQEVRCTPFNRNSLSETKTVVDKAYQKCVEHAYRMHWIKTEEELAIEKGAAEYLDDAMKKVGLLVSQIKSNSSEPGYILDDRAEYIEQMFDRRMRFPLRDRWNSIEEAKAHTDRAYQACLDHALRMNWIKGQ